jgi:hypothetical protein
VIRPQAPGIRPQGRVIATAVAAGLLLQTFGAAQTTGPVPVPGLSHRAALGRAYDAILSADFDLVPAQLASACDDVPAWCDVMDAVAQWWRIALDPDIRMHDALFLHTVERAISAATRWTDGEPGRAEAWFALGGAYGARAQWRVERKQRLAAARDGKRIKTALERALVLDPLLHDARFGVGMYHYYAAVAPRALRMFRWFLLLPGGNREEGLQQMIDGYELGGVVRDEAAYQLHRVYLWYEDRSAEALTLIRELRQRHPRNPLFTLIEATILDAYFHDAEASANLLRTLITRAELGEVNEAELALRRARALLHAVQTRSPH